jgi:hypothetical protein
MTKPIEPTIGEVWEITQMAASAMEKIGTAITGLTDRVLRMDAELSALTKTKPIPDYDDTIEEERQSRGAFFDAIGADISEFEPEMQPIMLLGVQRAFTVMEKGGYQLTNGYGALVYDGKTVNDLASDWASRINL